MRSPREPLDVERLSHEGAEVSFDFELTGLPQLRGSHAELTGRVHGRVRFGREQEFAVADLTLEGSATLQCQRCMGAMRQPLAARTRVALVGSEADGAGVPADLEPVLAAGGHISIEQLLAEELLLGLPIVPLHAENDEGCTAKGPQVRNGETHRPFADLAKLVKR
jgi:uncharacterized protein